MRSIGSSTRLIGPSGFPSVLERFGIFLARLLSWFAVLSPSVVLISVHKDALSTPRDISSERLCDRVWFLFLLPFLFAFDDFLSLLFVSRQDEEELRLNRNLSFSFIYVDPFWAIPCFSLDLLFFFLDFLLFRVLGTGGICSFLSFSL